MSVNREYKSSLFSTLFNDAETLLSLYNALSGSDLPLDTPVEIATLEDVFFNDRRNDVAFVLGDKIVILMEHQSSISANMPLHLLIYVARVYEKLIDNDAVYNVSFSIVSTKNQRIKQYHHFMNITLLYSQ